MERSLNRLCGDTLLVFVSRGRFLGAASYATIWSPRMASILFQFFGDDTSTFGPAAALYEQSLSIIKSSKHRGNPSQGSNASAPGVAVFFWFRGNEF